ncbi:MAG: hypothetical protein NWE93_00510 [Candidatus Bathyarchaeota archaeon]|nr:hypothetical protein [Candidatus Bathyarchaeota archaeon]
MTDMKRTQALSCINEIQDACMDLSQADKQQIEIKNNVQHADGYTILIKSFLTNVRKRQVSSIAQKYQLSMQEEDEGLMIYQPTKTKQTQKQA